MPLSDAQKTRVRTASTRDKHAVLKQIYRGYEMKWMCSLGIVGLLVLAVITGGLAADFSGQVSFCLDLLPGVAARSELGLTASGTDWTLSSDTSIAILPSFGVDESLTFVYDLAPFKLTAGATIGLIPLSFGSASLEANFDLLSVNLAEEDPTVTFSSGISGGAVYSGGVTAFADLDGRLRVQLGEHSLVSTTTFSVWPVGLTSTILVHVALGNLRMGEDGVSLENSISLLQSVVPFALSYVQLNSKADWGSTSLHNVVSYFGGGTVQIRSTLRVQWEPITAWVWGSYHSTASARWTAGLCASFTWGET